MKNIKSNRKWEVTLTGYGVEVDIRDFPLNLTNQEEVLEGQKDVALIAAAPELLDTLQEILNMDITGGYDDLHYKIHSVIKKARGE